MAAPVTGIVHFKVSITPYRAADDKWMVQTVETGIVTYGTTLEEAEAANRAANVGLVRAWKAHGRLALDRFMKRHSIVDYQVDAEPGVAIPTTNYSPLEGNLVLAA